MDFKTRCARGRPAAESVGQPLTPPIVMSASFEFDDLQAITTHYETGEGYVYSRYANPTVRSAEALLADLEGAEDAALFSSGMAAISTTLLTLAGSGDTVAAQKELYGGTSELLRQVLPGLGIRTRWLDRADLAAPEPAMLDGCRLLFLESPVNPTLGIIDLRRAAEAAAAVRIPVVVDGTFATPALQRPLELGCQLVVHSCTKYLGGHGDLLGGAVAGSRERLAPIALRRRALGGTLDPISAFLLYRGMRTLAVRMEAHERGARAVAEGMSEHPRVRRVLWPGLPGFPDHELARRQMSGFGGMVTLDLDGGAEAVRRVHDGLRLISRAGSLGGVETLASIPVHMSHRSLGQRELAEAGVTPGMLRLSIGLESPADLLADLRQALERIP